MSRTSRRQRAQTRPLQQGRETWTLRDAKAQFSELVRLARGVGPQRVTVRGKDAVFVVSAEQFAALVPSKGQSGLHVVLSTSRLRDVDMKLEGQTMPVRDVSL